MLIMVIYHSFWLTKLKLYYFLPSNVPTVPYLYFYLPSTGRFSRSSLMETSANLSVGHFKMSIGIKRFSNTTEQFVIQFLRRKLQSVAVLLRVSLGLRVRSIFNEAFQVLTLVSSNFKQTSVDKSNFGMWFLGYFLMDCDSELCSKIFEFQKQLYIIYYIIVIIYF